VGVPFKNTRITLIDENGKEANEGEICISGTCLTMGYYNNPEKTAEVFVQNPTNTAYPELVYRTGDIGRYNERGELVFVCRKDNQIKHMGHRIELGEIETAAEKGAEVSRAVCVYNKDKKEIALFYVGKSEEKAVSAALSAALPRYMLPASVTHLGALPLTDNGKINRKELLTLTEQ
jgi:acyl-CoA synthetase (AMP-forming)/AMP-acid ligase II